jgi:hypothetical protein
MREGFTRFLATIGAILLLVACISIFILQLQDFKKAKSSAAWVATEGVVLNTDYERTSVGRIMSKTPIVNYRYIVAGRDYLSNTLSFGDDFAQEDIFERYPPGRSVTVYYNPEKPWEATLIKGGEKSAELLSYVIFVMVLSFVFFVYVMFIRWKTGSACKS